MELNTQYSKVGHQCLPSDLSVVHPYHAGRGVASHPTAPSDMGGRRSKHAPLAVNVVHPHEVPVERQTPEQRVHCASFTGADLPDGARDGQPVVAGLEELLGRPQRDAQVGRALHRRGADGQRLLQVRPAHGLQGGVGRGRGGMKPAADPRLHSEGAARGGAAYFDEPVDEGAVGQRRAVELVQVRELQADRLEPAVRPAAEDGRQNAAIVLRERWASAC